MSTRRTRFILAVMMLAFLPQSGIARLRFRSKSHSSLQLRRRLNINPLITEPGTAEIEWSNVVAASGDYSMPSTLKFTPEGSQVYWGRTELSVSFDALSSPNPDTGRVTQFGDRVSVAANCVVFDGVKLDFAIAPQATFILRGDAGSRAGASAIARYDSGLNSTGVTLSWTGATAPSDTNPSGMFDAGFGYARRLRTTGFLAHFTPHTTLVWERSTGARGLFSYYEGVEYQITEALALDVSGQQSAAAGGGFDRQVAAGITLNLGRPRRWLR